MMEKLLLEQEYVVNRKSCENIGKDYGISSWTIRRLLKKYNIKTRSGGRIFVDISGKQFNNLIVLRLITKEERGYDSTHPKWLCQCKCGNVVITTYSALLRGQQGCSTCKNHTISIKKWGGCGEISGDFWNRVQRAARARNLKLEITICEGWELFLKQNRKCALSNIELYFSRNVISDTTASLDRINSDESYNLKNVQWLHKDVNKMKWDYPEHYFVDFCKKIAINKS